MTAIDHIGIAVEKLDEALPLWRDLLGLTLQEIEEVPSEGVRVAILRAGSTRVELLEPMHSDSPIAKHLERRGAGIHHLALKVEDLRQSMADLKAAGREALDEAPRPGAGGSQVTFVHPKKSGGVLLELVQPQEHGSNG